MSLISACIKHIVRYRSSKHFNFLFRVLGIEEGQAFLEDTEDNKLCLLEPYAESDGALQQARPL